jgi:hypothetical protein
MHRASEVQGKPMGNGVGVNIGVGVAVGFGTQSPSRPGAPHVSLLLHCRSQQNPSMQKDGSH